MTQSDWLFLTMIAIGVTTLTVIVVQVVRARRGKDDAVDQMLEVRQIAEDSLREVRDVVRGYRTGDLDV